MSEQNKPVLRQRYSAAFKRHAVEQMAGCPNLMALAAQLGIRRKFLYLWREQLQQSGETAFQRPSGRPRQGASPPAVSPVTGLPPAPPDPRDRQITAQQERIARLERQFGQKQMEVDFFRQTFAHVRGAMAMPTHGGAPPSTPASKPGSRAKASD